MGAVSRLCRELRGHRREHAERPFRPTDVLIPARPCYSLPERHKPHGTADGPSRPGLLPERGADAQGEGADSKYKDLRGESYRTERKINPLLREGSGCPKYKG
jgi:hypothetical protein